MLKKWLTAVKKAGSTVVVGKTAISVALIVAVLVVLPAISTLFHPFVDSTQATSPRNCSISEVKSYWKAKLIKLSRVPALNAFIIDNHTNCTFPVTVASFRMISDVHHQMQYAINHSNVSAHKAGQVFVVATPQCGYQIDIWYGNFVPTPGGNGTFVNWAAWTPDWTVNGLDGIQTGTPCNPATDISVTKTGPATVMGGNKLSYSLNVRNNGPDVVMGVTVTDPIPTGLTYDAASSDNACSQKGNSIVCVIIPVYSPNYDTVALNVNESKTFNLTFNTPTGGTCSPIVITNTATVTSTASQDTNQSNNQSTVQTQLQCPIVDTDVRIVKTGVASIVRGNNAIFNITVTNNGPASALNVVVNDPIPSGLTFQSSTDSSCSLQGNTVVCALGTMAAGSSRSFTLTFGTPTLPNCSTTNVTNVATVSTTTTDTNSSNNTSQATMQITCPPPQTGCIDIFKEGFDPSGNQLPTVPAFTFKLDGGVQTGTNNAAGHLTFQNVPVGTHTVTETMLPGWWQKLVTPVGGVVNVVAGQQCVGITFKNQQNPTSSSSSSSVSSMPQWGCININKIAQDENGNTISPTPSFQFISNDGGTAFNGPNGGARIDHVTPGAHSVEEVQQYGWDLVSVVPTGGRVIVPSNGLCASVTFVNRRAASSSSSSSSQAPQYGCIDIIKVAQNPNGGNISTVPAFTFDLNNGEQTTTNLSNGRARFNNVPVGQNIVSEDIPTGWSQMQIQPAGGIVNVTSGQFCATVTFINRQNALSSSSSSSSSSAPSTGCVEIKKYAYTAQGAPISNVPLFTFSFNGFQSTTNNSAGDAQFLNVPTGTHTISELVPAGWTLQSTFPSNGRVTVYPSANNESCAQISFSNRQIAQSSSSQSSVPGYGCIDVLKEAYNQNGALLPITPVFNFALGNGLQFGTNDSSGRLRFNNVPAGSHTVTESIPSGWTQINVTPSNGTVTVLPGNSCAGITFKNQQNALSSSSTSSSSTSSSSSSTSSTYGCIDIYKTSVDANGNNVYNPPSFTFVLDNNRSVSTDSSGRARFDNVASGTHTITENTIGNWRLESISPNNGVVTVNPGSCTTVFVRNRQEGCGTSCGCTGNCNGTLTVSKDDGRTNVSPGDTLTYVITVRNTSSVNMNNVTVTDTMSSDLTAQYASDGGSITNRFVTWRNVYMPAYGSRTFTVTARVDDDAEGSIVNRVDVNGASDEDINTVDGHSYSSSSRMSLSINKRANVYEVLPGGAIGYTVTIRNTGNGILRNVRITDNLPPSVTVTNNGGSNTNTDQVLTWNIGSLNRNEERTFNYAITLSRAYSAGQSVRNNVCAAADNSVNECASSTVNIIGNLPQTGFMSAGLTGGGSPYLRPMNKVQAIAHQSNGAGLPGGVWVAIVGVITGMGGMLARTFFLKD